MQCFGAAHQERVEDEIESEVGWKTGEAVLLKRNGRVKRRLVREELGPRHTLRKHFFLVPGSEASFPLNGGGVNWRRESLPLKSGARSYPRLLVALGADSAELDQFRGVTLDSGRTVTRAGSPASTLAAIARSRRRHGEGPRLGQLHSGGTGLIIAAGGHGVLDEGDVLETGGTGGDSDRGEIGRASCRERV